MRQRWFLEPPSRDVDSYVVVEYEERGTRWASASLKVADCDRNVKLHFPLGDARSRAASKRKLAKLRKALDLLEAEIYQ